MGSDDFTVEREIGEVPKNAREVIRATLLVAHGKPCADIRVWAEKDSGEVVATRKGLMLARDRVADLKVLVDQLAEACEGDGDEDETE